MKFRLAVAVILLFGVVVARAADPLQVKIALGSTALLPGIPTATTVTIQNTTNAPVFLSRRAIVRVVSDHSGLFLLHTQSGRFVFDLEDVLPQDDAGEVVRLGAHDQRHFILPVTADLVTCETFCDERLNLPGGYDVSVAVEYSAVASSFGHTPSWDEAETSVLQASLIWSDVDHFVVRAPTGEDEAVWRHLASIKQGRAQGVWTACDWHTTSGFEAAVWIAKNYPRSRYAHYTAGVRALFPQFARSAANDADTVLAQAADESNDEFSELFQLALLQARAREAVAALRYNRGGETQSRVERARELSATLVQFSGAARSVFARENAKYTDAFIRSVVVEVQEETKSPR